MDKRALRLLVKMCSRQGGERWANLGAQLARQPFCKPANGSGWPAYKFVYYACAHNYIRRVSRGLYVQGRRQLPS
jgi:hypothetical protein